MRLILLAACFALLAVCAALWRSDYVRYYSRFRAGERAIAQIELFRSQTGRLPRSLAEAGWLDDGETRISYSASALDGPDASYSLALCNPLDERLGKEFWWDPAAQAAPARGARGDRSLRRRAEPEASLARVGGSESGGPMRRLQLVGSVRSIGVSRATYLIGLPKS